MLRRIFFLFWASYSLTLPQLICPSETCEWFKLDHLIKKREFTKTVCLLMNLLNFAEEKEARAVEGQWSYSRQFDLIDEHIILSCTDSHSSQLFAIN